VACAVGDRSSALSLSGASACMAAGEQEPLALAPPSVRGLLRSLDLERYLPLLLDVGYDDGALRDVGRWGAGDFEEMVSSLVAAGMKRPHAMQLRRALAQPGHVARAPALREQALDALSSPGGAYLDQGEAGRQPLPPETRQEEHPAMGRGSAAVGVDDPQAILHHRPRPWQDGISARPRGLLPGSSYGQLPLQDTLHEVSTGESPRRLQAQRAPPQQQLWRAASDTMICGGSGLSGLEPLGSHGMEARSLSDIALNATTMVGEPSWESSSQPLPHIPDELAPADNSRIAEDLRELSAFQDMVQSVLTPSTHLANGVAHGGRVPMAWTSASSLAALLKTLQRSDTAEAPSPLSTQVIQATDVDLPLSRMLILLEEAHEEAKEVAKMLLAGAEDVLAQGKGFLVQAAISQGPRRVMDVVIQYPEDPVVQEQGWKAIGDLCSEQDDGAAAAAFGRYGACELVVSTMQRHARNLDIQCWCCRAVYLIAGDDMDNHARLGCAGVCEAVVQLLRNHSLSKDVQGYGCLAIAYLAWTTENRQKLIRIGAGSVLEAAALQFAGDEEGLLPVIQKAKVQLAEGKSFCRVM